MKLSENAVELVRRNNKVVYRDDGRIVKVFNAEKSSADVYNEALNTARVEGTGIAVPEVLEVSRMEEGEHAGSWALAHRYVAGTTLKDAWEADMEHADVYLDELVDFQIEVQGFRAPLLNRQKDKLHRMISATSGIIDATTRYDLHMRLDGMKEAEQVCHGDFVPSNIIRSDEDGRLYLCDWAHVTAGLPEVDAAMTYLLFALETTEAPEFAENYLERFCRRADVARQVVNYWLPVVAAAELSRGRKVREDFLKSWINVYDYE